jgi:hypothetical protein
MKRSIFPTIAIIMLIASVSACGAVTPATTPSPIDVSLFTASDDVPGAVVTTERLLAAFDEMIQDEYHAEAIYLGVMADFGEIRPFANIIRAERRHAENVAALYIARGFEVPVSRWTTDIVPRFGSVREACAAGVEAERENVRLYDRILELARPDGDQGALELPARRFQVVSGMSSFKTS